MLSKDEENYEIRQWGLILNLVRKRRHYSELKYSPAGKVVDRAINQLVQRIEEVRRS